MLPFPFNLSRRRIDGPERAPERRRIIIWKISAAVIRMPGLIRLRSRAENVALLPCSHIEEAGLRIESGRHPVCRPSGTGAHAAAVRRLRRFLVSHRAPLGILSAAPVNFAVRA